MECGLPALQESPPANREDQGVLSQFGVTVGQSVGAHLIVASTLKLVRALGDNQCRPRYGGHGGVRSARASAWRSRTSGRRSSPTASSGSSCRGRCGRAFRSKPGRPAAPRCTAAVDADLTTTPTAFGDARHLATGAEAWLGNRAVGVRGGVGINTVGETRRSGSVGASVAFRSGIFADAQLTRGDDEARNGWGFALRVTF